MHACMYVCVIIYRYIIFFCWFYSNKTKTQNCQKMSFWASFWAQCVYPALRAGHRSKKKLSLASFGCRENFQRSSCWPICFGGISPGGGGGVKRGPAPPRLTGGCRTLPRRRPGLPLPGHLLGRPPQPPATAGGRPHPGIPGPHFCGLLFPFYSGTGCDKCEGDSGVGGNGWLANETMKGGKVNRGTTHSGGEGGGLRRR